MTVREPANPLERTLLLDAHADWRAAWQALEEASFFAETPAEKRADVVDACRRLHGAEREWQWLTAGPLLAGRESTLRVRALWCGARAELGTATDADVDAVLNLLG